MQFGKVQGGALAGLGVLLLVLQAFIFFSSAQQAGSPSQAPATPTQGEQIGKFVPGVLGLLALGVGGYLVLLQGKRRGSEESQPEKTRSGLPM